MKGRHQIWLPDELGHELDRLGAKPGASKSGSKGAAVAFLSGARRASAD